jgi:hypothetical protein
VARGFNDPTAANQIMSWSGLRQAYPVDANALAPPAQRGGVEVVVHGHGGAVSMPHSGFAPPAVDVRENALPNLQIEPRPHGDLARLRDRGGRRRLLRVGIVVGVDRLGRAGVRLGRPDVVLQLWR